MITLNKHPDLFLFYCRYRNKDEILDCVTQLEERTSDEGCVGPSSLYRSYLAECPPETTSMPSNTNSV